MGNSPESVARDFYAAWASPDRDELAGFFADDAVWVDGAQGEHHGVDDVVSELANQLRAVGGVTVDVRTMLSDGGTVMVEQLSHSDIGGTRVSSVVMAVLEVDAAGKITQFREAYDLQSTLNNMKAAGFSFGR